MAKISKIDERNKPLHIPVDTVIGRVTLHGIGRMSAKQRKNVAGWLRHVAADLDVLGERYSDKRFTARLYQA